MISRVSLVALVLLLAFTTHSQRLMETLGRGVVAINQGPTLTEQDLVDLPALLQRLRAHDDAFSQFLFGRLSEYSLQALTNPTATHSLPALLVNDLNITLQQGESIYS